MFSTESLPFAVPEVSWKNIPSHGCLIPCFCFGRGQVHEDRSGPTRGLVQVNDKSPETISNKGQVPEDGFHSSTGS